jgi:molecular chaperone GrpE
MPRQQHLVARTCPLQHARYFSDKGPDTSQEKAEAKEEEKQVVEEENVTEEDAPKEEAEAELSREEQLEQQVKDLKDQLLRGLAEQENTRRIAKRDVQTARNFAVTSFAKSLLDTSDNLARALESVPEEEREKNAVLSNLYEGIQMTEAGLLKAFEKNGLVRYGEVGDKFDPNLHEALFEYPDPEKVAGTVGQVMKKGFSLNDRVVRPAEVGVVKKD